VYVVALYRALIDTWKAVGLDYTVICCTECLNYKKSELSQR